ncbi:MAG: hypothetical protein SGPRY_004671, partial [Prymnesium sp.]
SQDRKQKRKLDKDTEAGAQGGTFKKKASLEKIMVVSHRDRLFDDIYKIHINSGHCKDRALHDAEQKAHGASISHKIQDLFGPCYPTCIGDRPRKTMVAGHTPILTKGFGTRGQVDLVDLQSAPDGRFNKYLMNYQGQLLTMLQGGQAHPWVSRLHTSVIAELPADLGDDQLLTRWLENTGFVYRLATRMVNEALGEMGRRGKALKAPDAAERELWRMQQQALRVRAQVCLVLQMDDEVQTLVRSALVLNRPMASRVDLQLARQLLFGSRQSLAGAEDTAASPRTTLELMVSSFGESSVYRGGPHAMDEPGVCIHGRADLARSEELSPGAGLFAISVADALDAVLCGDAKQSDFRLFLVWFLQIEVPQALPTVVDAGCYELAAEVMQLCGGEFQTMSELLERENNEGSTPESGGNGPAFRNTD